MANTISTSQFGMKYWADNGAYILVEEASTLGVVMPNIAEPFILVSERTGAGVAMVPTGPLNDAEGSVVEWRWAGHLPDGRGVTVVVAND